MAITTSESQVSWTDAGGSSSSITISSATEVVSNEITIPDNVRQVDVHAHVDNGGTPGAGDTCVLRVRGSGGDILGNSGNDYSTQKRSKILTTLNTYSTDTTGEDPAADLIVDACVPRKLKFAATCANAATRNMTLYVRLVLHAFA